MNDIVALDAVEIDFVNGGKGFFETVGWAIDNPGTAAGRLADRFYNWYKLTDSEDPNWFIGS